RRQAVDPPRFVFRLAVAAARAGKTSRAEMRRGPLNWWLFCHKIKQNRRLGTVSPFSPCDHGPRSVFSTSPGGSRVFPNWPWDLTTARVAFHNWLHAPESST